MAGREVPGDTCSPLAETEFVYGAEHLQVSVTDLEGIVSYANEAFLFVSGYNAEEIIGHPRKMLRHPGMPDQAFDDMWRNLHAGRPWNALVKNRRKGGQAYWVAANVTPVIRDGKPVSFLSVWAAADAAERARAEALYSAQRPDGTAKYELLDGMPHRTGALWRGWRRLGRVFTGLHRQAPLCVLLAMVALLVATLDSIDPTSAAVMAAGAAATAAWSAWQNARSARAMDEILASADQLAGCDLCQPAPVDAAEWQFQRLRTALQQVRMNLRATVMDVRQQAVRLTDASRKMFASTGELAQRNAISAARLEASAGAMQELSELVIRNADAAVSVNDAAVHVQAQALQGQELVARSAEAMAHIASESLRLRELVDAIDQISVQTSLLALNAAVQAAHVGPAGRSFGVLAQEVRELSARSAASARAARTTLGDMGKSIQAGNDRSASALAAITTIGSTCTRLVASSDAMAAASREQAAKISLSAEQMRELDLASQHITRVVAQHEVEAAQIRDLAQSLKGGVSVFQLG